MGDFFIHVTDEAGFREDPDTLASVATAFSNALGVGLGHIKIRFGPRRLQQFRSDARRLSGAGVVDMAYDIEVHKQADKAALTRAYEVVEKIKHLNLDPFAEQLAGTLGSAGYDVTGVTVEAEPRIQAPRDGRGDDRDTAASGSKLLMLTLGALLFPVVGGLVLFLAWLLLRRSQSQRMLRRAVEGPALKVKVPENFPLLNIGEAAEVPALPSGGELVSTKTLASRELSQVALQGKTAKAKMLLMEGAEADFQDPEDDKITPLMNAAFGGSLDVCRVLLDANAEVNLRSAPGSTPLMMACQGGHKEVVQYLLSKKAEVSFKTDDRETAMFFAADIGSTELAQMLLDHGATVKGVRSAGNLCLARASEKGYPDMVELLKKAGARHSAQCQCPACVEFPTTPTHRSPSPRKGSPSPRKVTSPRVKDS